MNYVSHFGLSKQPFTLTPDTHFFIPTQTHVETLHLLKESIAQGEGFIKISGEIGTGKTLLCRLLLNALHGKRAYAYIPNPALSPLALKLQLASELQLKVTHTHESLLNRDIERQLLGLYRSGKPVVLVIDEAQTMPDETLEAVRLFSNLETETGKLLQIVLFGQPELDDKLDKSHLRQIRQRISFSQRLQPLSTAQTYHYLNHRVKKAGYTGEPLFGYVPALLIRLFCQGAPRLTNIVAHKTMILAACRRSKRISVLHVLKAIWDTEYCKRSTLRWFRIASVLFALGGGSVALAVWSLT